MIFEIARDVMQVCRQGHVITDRLGTHPERGLSHCDRCDAPTLSRCPTCAAELPGALLTPGPKPIGTPTLPRRCPVCGTEFPWVRRKPRNNVIATLEPLLARLPRLIRQLRDRYRDRPGYFVRDEHDLDDLMRSVLHMHFDDVRLEGRTPSYALETRTDLLLDSGKIALTAKLVTPTMREPQIAQQIREDIDYYARTAMNLVFVLYDPSAELWELWRFNDAKNSTELDVRIVVIR